MNDLPGQEDTTTKWPTVEVLSKGIQIGTLSYIPALPEKKIKPASPPWLVLFKANARAS